MDSVSSSYCWMVLVNNKATNASHAGTSPLYRSQKLQPLNLFRVKINGTKELHSTQYLLQLLCLIM